jgi:hypothetical protein
MPYPYLFIPPVGESLSLLTAIAALWADYPKLNITRMAIPNPLSYLFQMDSHYSGVYSPWNWTLDRLIKN